MTNHDRLGVIRRGARRTRRLPLLTTAEAESRYARASPIAAALPEGEEVLHLNAKQVRELDEGSNRRASISAEDLAKVALREAALEVEPIERRIPLG